MTRGVLDTSILVRGHARTTGPARAVVQALTTAPHTLILSPFIVAEVERVLNYPRLQARWPLTPEEIREFLDALRLSAEMVDADAAGAESVVSRDPDDDPIVLTAVLGRAEVLCTLDRHFRDPPVMANCASRGIQVMSDVELLHFWRTGATQEGG